MTIPAEMAAVPNISNSAQWTEKHPEGRNWPWSPAGSIYTCLFLLVNTQDLHDYLGKHFIGVEILPGCAEYHCKVLTGYLTRGNLSDIKITAPTSLLTCSPVSGGNCSILAGMMAVLEGHAGDPGETKVVSSYQENPRALGDWKSIIRKK